MRTHMSFSYCPVAQWPSPCMWHTNWNKIIAPLLLEGPKFPSDFSREEKMGFIGDTHIEEEGKVTLDIASRM